MIIPQYIFENFTITQTIEAFAFFAGLIITASIVVALVWEAIEQSFKLAKYLRRQWR